MSNYIKIGTIVAVTGLEGTLILQHELGKKTDFKTVEAFFLRLPDGKLLPYFPTEVKVKTDKEVLLKLEGIATREKAQTLLRKEVWLPTETAHALAARNAPISLLGYQLFDDGKKLSEVLEVIEQPQQLLLRIEMKGKEVLIPLHDATLRGIDHAAKRIDVVLPDGLLDIYLA